MQNKLGGVVISKIKTIPQSATLTDPFTQGAFERKCNMKKIVFATTTTMNPAQLPCANPRDNITIDKYNEIAVKIAKDNGVFINDLNQLTCNWSSEYYKDYCHFTEEASAVLGKAVAEKIKKLL